MGEHFGWYRLERLLGRGGMGEVWLARDTESGRVVALKVLAQTVAADAGYRRRFEREARLGSQLRNPHVVRIHRFGEQNGRLFIDMEYIEGIDLAAMLGRVGTLNPAAAVDFVTSAVPQPDPRALLQPLARPPASAKWSGYQWDSKPAKRSSTVRWPAPQRPWPMPTPPVRLPGQ